MQNMSSKQNEKRRQPLRLKQQEAVDLIEKAYNNNMGGKFLFIFPGGYGKTKAAIASYDKARSLGWVNRLLVVVPSREQKTGWMECGKDFKALGLDVLEFALDDSRANPLHHKACTTDAGFHDFALKRSFQNKCEVFVVTYQALAGSCSGRVSELMSKGRWMVVAEECHHCAVDMQWGKAVQQLPYEILVGLSATPFRSKGEHLFSSIIPDEGQKSNRVIHCTIEEAIEEGAIRPMRVKRGKYQVEFEQPDKTRHIFKLGDLSKYLYENNLELSEWEAKNQLRVLDQFVRPLFMQALDQLDDLNRLHPGEHQMIVHAPSVLTARTYCKWINLLADTTGGVAAKWVGSGSELSDKENEEIIADFKANKFPVLVQVQMFGEGSDNPRASVGLWFSLTGSYNPSCHQGIVRHSRRNMNIPQEKDFCYLFIPEDSPGLDRALMIQARQEFILEVKDSNQGEEEGAAQLKLPTLEELEKTIRAIDSELLGIEDSDAFARKKEQILSAVRDPNNIKDVASKTQMSVADASVLIEGLIASKAEEIIRLSLNQAHAEVSEQHLHEYWMKQVESTVKRIARYIAQKNHPVAVEQSTFSATVGSLKRRLNGILKRHVANGTTRSALSISDLRRQYDYLEKLVVQITNDPDSMPADLNI